MTPAQEKLVLDHLDYARRIARVEKRKLPAAVSLEDVEGLARVGLCEAAIKYETSLGTPFKVYSYLRIRGSIWSHFRRKGEFQSYKHESLDKRARSGGNDPSGNSQGIIRTLADEHCIDARETPDVAAHRSKVQGDVRRRIGSLAPLERAVIRMHYDDGLTLAEIGRQLGISERKAAAVARDSKQTLRRECRTLQAAV